MTDFPLPALALAPFPISHVRYLGKGCSSEVSPPSLAVQDDGSRGEARTGTVDLLFNDRD